jgi:hypothetical protein
MLKGDKKALEKLKLTEDDLKKLGKLKKHDEG